MTLKTQEGRFTMKRIGKIIMEIGAFISVIGACALDSDGFIYSKVLLIIMIGILITLAGYCLICLDAYILGTKKSHPYMLCRAGAIRKEFK